MTGYTGVVDYYGFIGRKCAMCDEQLESEHSAVKHDFYGDIHDLILCEYCAPVVIARLARDLLSMSGIHNLECYGLNGVTSRDCAPLYKKEKIQFSNGHREYLEDFMQLVEEANK